MTNDSETKGPETPLSDAHEVDLNEVVSTAMYTDGKRRVVEKYVPSYIAKRIEQELEQAHREIAEVRRERDELAKEEVYPPEHTISRLSLDVDRLGKSNTALCVEINNLRQERDRYRELLKSFADRLEQIASEMRAPNGFTPRFFQLAIAAREALHPPTPKPASGFKRCPTCNSPSPWLHPATQCEGEVLKECEDTFHKKPDDAVTREGG